MQLMLDGGFGDLQILDSSRYRSLYIAKVYEVSSKDQSSLGKKQDDISMFFDTLTIKECPRKNPIEENEDLAFEKDNNAKGIGQDLQEDEENEDLNEIIIDLIGLSQIQANKNFYMKFITIY